MKTKPGGIDYLQRGHIEFLRDFWHISIHGIQNLCEHGNKHGLTIIVIQIEHVESIFNSYNYLFYSSSFYFHAWIAFN